MPRATKAFLEALRKSRSKSTVPTRIATPQKALDEIEEQRRKLEHAIMAAAGLPPCPNIAHAEYVHLGTCDAIAAVLAAAGVVTGTER